MNSVKINIVGDFCISQLDGLHFGEVLKRQLADSDINVVNLEGPILSEGALSISKSGPHLYQDAGVPEFLEENGFNAIALANNHIMDYGSESLLKTKHSFAKAKVFGAGTFTEAYRIEVFDIKNIKIGFLSLTQYEFGVLGLNQNDQDEIGSAWFCHPVVDELIINAKNHCDFLIIIPHAGLEYFEFPLPEMRTIYQHYICMGADAVIGGHPHVPQGWEFYNEKPIMYSLGNFCFDHTLPARDFWFQGLLAMITISRDGKVKLDVNNIVYSPEQRIVDIINNKKLDAHYSHLCKILQNKDEYLSIVNRKCLELNNQYLNLFEMSGFYKLTLRKSIHYTIRTIINKYVRFKDTKYEYTHVINNLRCETHRWVISRIYEISNKIKL